MILKYGRYSEARNNNNHFKEVVNSKMADNTAMAYGRLNEPEVL